MSKEVDWGVIHGEGDIVSTCEMCDLEHRYPFEDQDVDYR